MTNMPRTYYNYLETDKSRDMLSRITGKVDFVLIGGWAVNLYVDIQRSKDIDIAISPEQLEYFRKYGVHDYGISVKYSVINDVSIDLFINGISDKELTIPINEIFKHSVIMRGMKVVDKNMLLLLKLCGYFREDTIKLDKDIIDVVSLLFYAGLDINQIRDYIDKYKIDERRGHTGMLEYLDKSERLWEFISNTKDEYIKFKTGVKKEINSVFNKR